MMYRNITVNGMLDVERRACSAPDVLLGSLAYTTRIPLAAFKKPTRAMSLCETDDVVRARGLMYLLMYTSPKKKGWNQTAV